MYCDHNHFHGVSGVVADDVDGGRSTEVVVRVSRRGAKEFLALCSTLKLYSLQFEEVPVTPPGGNVNLYGEWSVLGSVSYLEDCL